MYSVSGDTTSLVPGFPIRTSSDQRSVDSSPRHNAASHVLHRLPVPRHPPCALKHLQHKTQKIVSEESEIAYQTQKHAPPPKRSTPHCACQMLATTIHKSNTTPHHQSGATTRHPEPSGRHPHKGRHHLRFPTRDEEIAGLLSQSPIVCLMNFPRPAFPTDSAQCLLCTRPPPTTGERPSNESLRSPNSHAMWAGLKSRGAP